MWPFKKKDEVETISGRYVPMEWKDEPSSKSPRNEGPAMERWMTELPEAEPSWEFDPELIEAIEGGVQTPIESLALADAELTRTAAERDRYALEIAEIKGALNTVAVFEGLVEGSPTAMMVSQICRDHEELEQRIENALVYVADDNPGEIDRHHVVHLLRGGTPIPDTIEGIEG